MNNQLIRTTRPPPPMLLAAGVFATLLVLYALTAQRGVSWQDSGEFQYRVLVGDYQWHAGLARAHPLYILIARGFVACFPASSRLAAINLCSGVGMAVALAFLAALVGRLTSNWRRVLLAVALLGLSHMAWWMATIAEVYTWALAALMAELYVLLRVLEQRRLGWLVLLFAANGLHLAIHNTAWLSLPVYLVLLPGVLRGRPLAARLGWVSAAAVAWMVGAAPLLVLMVQEYARTGDGLATLQSLLFGTGYQARVLGLQAPLWRQTAANFALAGVSLLNPCWLLAIPGIVEGVRGVWRKLRSGRQTTRQPARLNAMRVSLLAITVLHFLFWIRYFVPDQATFVLPTLGLLSVWVGIGRGSAAQDGASQGCASARWARGWWRLCHPCGWLVWLVAGIVCAVGGPLVLRAAVTAGRIEINRGRDLPFRDEARYWLLPWKQHENSAVQFVEGVDRQLGAGDVLVADATAAGPLMAMRQLEPHPDAWRLITPWSGETDAELAALVRQPAVRLYVVSPVPGYVPSVLLAPGVRAVREGLLWRLEGGE